MCQYISPREERQREECKQIELRYQSIQERFEKKQEMDLTEAEMRIAYEVVSGKVTYHYNVFANNFSTNVKLCCHLMCRYQKMSVLSLKL